MRWLVMLGGPMLLLWGLVCASLYWDTVAPKPPAWALVVVVAGWCWLSDALWEDDGCSIA